GLGSVSNGRDDSIVAFFHGPRALASVVICARLMVETGFVMMNIAVSYTASGLPPRRAFNVDDIRRMIEAGVLHESENIELVEGEIVVMAAKGYAHEMVRQALIKAVNPARTDAD